jgi:hypothetical protein
MSPLRATSPSMILGTLWSYVPFKAIYPLYGPMSSLRPSATSTALCNLYGPLPPLQPLCPLNCPLSPLQLLPLYDPLSHLRPLAKKAKRPVLFREMFCQTRFVKTPRVAAIYFVLAMIAMIAIIRIITQAKCSAIIAK